MMTRGYYLTMSSAMSNHAVSQ